MEIVTQKEGLRFLGWRTVPVCPEVLGERARACMPVIEQCSAKGVKVGIVVSTGFGETGEEGKKLERKMLATARRGGMRLMGPNCMGMYSAAASINASIIDLAPGNMSLVLQFQREAAQSRLQLLVQHRQPAGPALQRFRQLHS